MEKIYLYYPNKTISGGMGNSENYDCGCVAYKNLELLMEAHPHAKKDGIYVEGGVYKEINFVTESTKEILQNSINLNPDKNIKSEYTPNNVILVKTKIQGINGYNISKLLQNDSLKLATELILGCPKIASQVNNEDTIGFNTTIAYSESSEYIYMYSLVEDTQKFLRVVNSIESAIYPSGIGNDSDPDGAEIFSFYLDKKVPHPKRFKSDIVEYMIVKSGRMEDDYKIRMFIKFMKYDDIEMAPSLKDCVW